MAIVNECKAKNPNTCRFHRPNADTEAFGAWKQAQTKLEDLSNRLSEDENGEIYSEYLGARFDEEQAEADYNATTSGLVRLLLLMENKELPDNELEELKYKYQNALHTLAQGELNNQIDDEAGGSLVTNPADDKYKAPTFTAGGNDLWPERTGSNYDRNLNGVKLKAAINKEFKKAVKEGHLPAHLDYVVRTSGRRVHCEIRGVSATQIYEDVEDRRHWNTRKDAKELRDRVENIVNSFNHWQYDTIESRRNYGHFWDRIEFEEDYRRERRLGLEAEKAAAKQAGL